MAVRCGLRWNESKSVPYYEDTLRGSTGGAECGGAGAGGAESGGAGGIYESEANKTDDENEFDQWDSSWYWDNGFADLSMSKSDSLNDVDDADDDDDLEILPNPDSTAPFNGRLPAMADIIDDDIIVWHDASLVGDFDTVECDYQTPSDVMLNTPIQFSMVYTICRPMFELNLPASHTTFYETHTSGLERPDRVRHAASDDDVITSGGNEASNDCRTVTFIDLPQSPSFETLHVFGTNEWNCVEDKPLSLICDSRPLVVASVESPGGRQTSQLTKSSPDDVSHVMRCIECDRTLAWLGRLRVNQHRQFEACVLIGLCVGLCLGLGAGVLIGSLASRQSLMGDRRTSTAQAGHITIDVEKTSTSGVIWREKFEEIMSENERLKVKLSAIESEIVRLLRQAQGSLSELSTSLELLNDLELKAVTSVEPVDKILDFESNEVRDEL